MLLVDVWLRPDSSKRSNLWSGALVKQLLEEWYLGNLGKDRHSNKPNMVVIHSHPWDHPGPANEPGPRKFYAEADPKCWKCGAEVPGSVRMLVDLQKLGR